METENTQETTQPQIELFVTDEAKGYINETRKWAKFLAILGFIGSGLIAIMAVFAGSMFSTIWGGASFMISILYLLMALLYFFPLYTSTALVKRQIEPSIRKTRTN